MLCRSKDMAKTSGRPGKTQLINHFLINNSWYLVDLPGYGYAKISKSAREAWKKMITGYFLNRETLLSAFVLIDSRIPPQEIDLQFVSFLGRNGIPLSIVFTKTDKQSQRVTAQNVNKFKQALLQEWEELPPMFLTSSATSSGRDKLLAYIDQIMQQ